MHRLLAPRRCVAVAFDGTSRFVLQSIGVLLRRTRHDANVINDVFAAATSSEHPNLKLTARTGQNRNATDGQDWAEKDRGHQKQTIEVV